MLIRTLAILTLSLSFALVAPSVGQAEDATSQAEAAAEAAAEASAAPPCTSPSQDGCATCCRPLEGGMCTQLSWTGGGSSKTVPWYNAQKALGKACPPDCRKCAECLDRDRETLEKLKRPEGCVCEETDPGVDPCHAPMSCECFCSRYVRLAAKCVDGGVGKEGNVDPQTVAEEDEGGW